MTEPAKRTRPSGPVLLSRTAEYGLRAAAVLSRLAPGESIRARELAERIAVPPHYVSKVMRKLVVARIAESRKGHGGGFRLAKAPAAISLGAVLEACSFDLAQRRCVFGWSRCDDANPCPLHPSWTTLRLAFERWATETTLADLSPAESMDS